MTLTALLTLAGFQLLLAMSPGPASVLTIKTAASQGARAGFLLSVGFGIAVAIWAGAALAGLSVVFEVAPFLQTTFRIIGAAFLIYVGWSMWRHASEPIPERSSAPVTNPFRLIRLGIITDLANPKALAYFAAIFTGIMPEETSVTTVLTILTLIFCIEFFWYSFVTMVFSRPKPRQLYARIKSWLDRVFGGILALLGLRIALP